MAQYLKDAVRGRIIAAAAMVFARHGFADATIGEIAAAARISPGNIYRYYENKRVLFDDVVSAAFARRFTALLSRRVRSLDGVDDVRALEARYLYHLASEDLLRFCIDNRLRVVILLGRSQGSRYAHFGERTVRNLIDLAIAHFRALRPEIELTDALRFNLRQIYHGFVKTMVTVLESFDDEPTIREIVAGYTRYHLAGLKHLFEGTADEPAPAATRYQRRPAGRRRRR
ncbi:MAG: TetR/AcrR family transcriptional regulator [Candidatus Binatia bacterium]